MCADLHRPPQQEHMCMFSPLKVLAYLCCHTHTQISSALQCSCVPVCPTFTVFHWEREANQIVPHNGTEDDDLPSSQAAPDFGPVRGGSARPPHSSNCIDPSLQQLQGQQETLTTSVPKGMSNTYNCSKCQWCICHQEVCRSERQDVGQ